MTAEADDNKAAGAAPASRGLHITAARAALRGYKLTLSPLIGFHCRHLPTCSDYMDEAITRHGLWAGGWVGVARLCRCHPFGTAGIDRVPQELPKEGRWYSPWRYGRWRGPLDADW